MLADMSQFPFQDSFPNDPPSDTSAEPLGFNNLIDNIWDLRRKNERRFDPLLYLGDDVMQLVLLYAVSLWDIVESRAWGTEIIPINHISDPLVLASVSRRWSQFITSSPQLWSSLLVNTDDDDVLEYLKLFLQLSCNTKLLIVLHGSATLCDAIVVDLLQVGDCIEALVYPPNISRSTLARFQFYLDASHDQLKHVCRWYMLDVQSGMQPQQYMSHYSFPASIQSLWMGGLLPLSRLVTLSYFQSLSFLSVRVSHDRFLPPTNQYRLELPKLEVLRVQMALGSHDQVGRPIHMACRNLKLLDLRYKFELDLEKWKIIRDDDSHDPDDSHDSHDPDDSHEFHGPYALRSLRGIPATRMKFGGFVALEKLQIDLAIQTVERLELIGMGALLVVMLMVQLRRELDSKWERQQGSTQLLQLLPGQEQMWWRTEEMWQQMEKHLGGPGEWEKLTRYLEFMGAIKMNWRKWHNLPRSLTHIQQSSLKYTLSTGVHQETPRVIRDLVEDILVWRLPQLTNMGSSDVLPISPNYLRKLRFHGFAMSHSSFSINYPSLVSLEIIAESPDHLFVMGFIRAPQLRVLRVQVEDGPGTVHKHDWGHTTNNRLDHISLRIEIPRDKQGIHALVFHLPQTQSLNVFAPYIPLHLYLAKPAPLFYTLNAGLEIISGPSGSQGRTLSTMWNEDLVTEWINPCGVPRLARFMALISLQQIVLSQRPYILSEHSPADTLFKLLEQNIDTCPQLNSITLAQCPSSWPRFLYQLRRRNQEAMLLRTTKCIEELAFYQPLHATIIRWLVDAIKARVLNVIERPPIREGDAWPMRPFEAEGVFRSYYVCHITGMELGCLEYETRKVDCGRERREGSKIYAG